MSSFIRFPFEDFCKRTDCDYKFVDSVDSAFCVPDGIWLAGGAIRRTLIKQPLDSDFDFFFYDERFKKSWESTLLAYGEGVVDLDQLSNKRGFKKVKETEHRVQYEGYFMGKPVVFQGIYFKYYNNIEEVLDSFDYTITQFAIDDLGFLVTTPEALWDLGRKRLAINKITYPVASLRRMLKYSSQGFTVCGGCMADFIEKSSGMENMEFHYID